MIRYEVKYHDHAGNGWRRIEYAPDCRSAIAFALRDDDVFRVVSCKPYHQGAQL